MTHQASRLIRGFAAVSMNIGLAACSHYDVTGLPDGPGERPVRHTSAMPQSEASLALYDVKGAAAQTRVPIGAYDFCRRNAHNCPPVAVLNQRFAHAQGAPMTYEKLAVVNDAVNRRYVPTLDIAMHGVEERWSYPLDRADCEDFALQKRLELLQEGVPADKMSIALVKLRSNGEGHAILLVEIDEGIFALDNLQEAPVPYEETQGLYHYIKWTDDIRHWRDFPARIVNAAVASVGSPQ